MRDRVFRSIRCAAAPYALAVGLLLAAGAIPDLFRTATNVTGDLATAALFRSDRGGRCRGPRRDRCAQEPPCAGARRRNREEC